MDTTIETIEFPRMIKGREPKGTLVVDTTRVSVKSISELLAVMASQNMITPTLKTAQLDIDGRGGLLPFKFSATPLMGAQIHLAFTKLGGLIGLYDSLISNEVEVMLFHTFQYLQGRSLCLVWTNFKGAVPNLFLVETDVDRMIEEVTLRQYRAVGQIPPEFMKNDLSEKFERGLYQGDYAEELHTYSNRMWLMNVGIPQTLVEILTNHDLSFL